MKTCFECGRPAEHDHHVVPRSLGGTKTVPLCGACHGKVHDAELTNSRELSRRVLARKRARGELVGCVPFGYRAEAGCLREDEAEQASLREVLRLRDEGLSFREIAAREIPGRRGPLRLRRVWEIVRDRGRYVVVSS